jgi:hypothetical protein
MATRITGPREFFLELKSLFSAIGSDIHAGRASLETKDALARTLSYTREIDVPSLPHRIHGAAFEISADDVNAIELARDTFRQVIQGNTDFRGDEARKALSALLRVMPRMSSTWNDGESA